MDDMCRSSEVVTTFSALDNPQRWTDDRPMTRPGHTTGYSGTEGDLAAICVALGAAAADLTAPEAALVEACASGTAEQSAVEAAHGAICDGLDPLGDSFCAGRAPGERRRDGAIYTPGHIVRSMVAWTLAHRPARVVDAGCGSGRFAVALRRAGFEGELVAIDLDPLATLMTRAHLATAGFENERVLCGDFLDHRLPRARGITAFIGNPPYVRHHTLDADTKEWGRRAGERAGVKISGLSGLHVLFIMSAHLSSRQGDIGCYITSAEWLDVGYGVPIRKLMAGPMGCRFMDSLDPRSSTFDDAMSTAVIVGWQEGYTGPVKVRRVAASAVAEGIGTGRSLPRERLATTSRWGDLHQPVQPIDSRLIPLSDLARVHRGVATGANTFFSIPFEAAGRLGLTDHLKPCLNRAATVIGARGVVRASDCTHGLLDLGHTAPDDPALARHLERGTRDGIPQRYLCRHRKPWWRVGGKAAPPIVVTYMARQPPSFALNPDRCQILNVLLGIHFREEVAPELQIALVEWLGAHRDELRGYRTYHGGLQKWEPRDLEAILVPRLEDLR